MFHTEGLFAVGCAEMGNLGPLIERLENPAIDLEQIERKWLAARLRGKGRGRPPEELGWNAARTLAVFEWTVKIDGYPIEAAKNKAATWGGVSELTVDRWRKAEERLEPLARAMLHLWRAEMFQAVMGKLSADQKEELRGHIFGSITK